MNKISLVALAFIASTNASAQVITFDDLSGLSTIQNGYAGLTWNNFYTVDRNYEVNSGYPVTGYTNGIVSESTVALNGYALPASFSSANSFTFNGAYLTAAWNDGLHVNVVGYRNGNMVDQKDFSLDTYAPTYISFNWSNVDSISFSSDGGISHGYGGGGSHFALDNLSINQPVPEPETYAMMLTGLAGLGFFSKKRSKKSA